MIDKNVKIYLFSGIVFSLFLYSFASGKTLGFVTKFVAQRLDRSRSELIVDGVRSYKESTSEVVTRVEGVQISDDDEDEFTSEDEALVDDLFLTQEIQDQPASVSEILSVQNAKSKETGVIVLPDDTGSTISVLGWSDEAVEARVRRVIDGDTIELDNGERVRYIGVDTPELNDAGAEDDECLAWTARLRNERLLANGRVFLYRDDSVDRDKYNRLLRYVYVEQNFINKTLVAEGMGRMFFCKANYKNCPVTSDFGRESEIRKAAQEAEENKRGVYSGVCGAKTHSVEDYRSHPFIDIRTSVALTPLDKGELMPEDDGIALLEQVEEPPIVVLQRELVIDSPQEPIVEQSNISQASETVEEATSTEDNENASSTMPDLIAVASSTASTTMAQRPDHLVIRQVSLAGETATDEFVELYNPTMAPINLLNYRLSKKTKSGAETNLLTTFPSFEMLASSSYLIVHPSGYDRSTVADNVYSTGQSLAINNTLILYSSYISKDNNVVADKFGWGEAGDFETAAFAVSTSKGQSYIRRWDVVNDMIVDTDNNTLDFIIATSAPRNSIVPIVLDAATTSATFMHSKMMFDARASTTLDNDLNIEDDLLLVFVSYNRENLASSSDDMIEFSSLENSGELVKITEQPYDDNASSSRIVEIYYLTNPPKGGFDVFVSPVSEFGKKIFGTVVFGNIDVDNPLSDILKKIEEDEGMQSALESVL